MRPQVPGAAVCPGCACEPPLDARVLRDAWWCVDCWVVRLRELGLSEAVLRDVERRARERPVPLLPPDPPHPQEATR